MPACVRACVARARSVTIQLSLEAPKTHQRTEHCAAITIIFLKENACHLNVQEYTRTMFSDLGSDAHQRTRLTTQCLSLRFASLPSTRRVKELLSSNQSAEAAAKRKSPNYLSEETPHTYLSAAWILQYNNIYYT